MSDVIKFPPAQKRDGGLSRHVERAGDYATMQTRLQEAEDHIRSYRIGCPDTTRPRLQKADDALCRYAALVYELNATPLFSPRWGEVCDRMHRAEDAAVRLRDLRGLLLLNTEEMVIKGVIKRVINDEAGRPDKLVIECADRPSMVEVVSIRNALVCGSLHQPDEELRYDNFATLFTLTDTPALVPGAA